MSTFDDSDPTARVSRHEIEVTATPEEVWQAIATGPGIAAWFVPAEVEEREGGTIVTDHGPYGRSTGTVTTWQPPHRFAYLEADWNPAAPDAPPWATEMLVEARAGGTCVVRLVSGFFSDGEGWEEHLAGTEEGWAACMLNLRLYLAHFAGLPATRLLGLGTVPEGQDTVLAALRTAAGLDGHQVGDAVRLADGAPATTGVLEDVAPHHLVVRTQEPCPGLLELGAFSHVAGPGDQTTTVAVRGYLYGEDGPEVARRDEPRWRSWMAAQLKGFVEVT